MKMNNSLKTDSTKDVLCDICDKTIQLNYGLLKAELSSNLYDRNVKYEVRLCKSCFLGTISYLKNQKKLLHLFDENFDFKQLDNLGLS